MALIQYMQADGDLTLRVTLHCPRCHGCAIVEHVPTEGLQHYLMGVPAAIALPGMADADRDKLVTGYHPWCITQALAGEIPDDVSGLSSD